MSRVKKLYLPFVKAGVQTLIAYRFNVLGFVIGGLIYCFVMFYLWQAVFISSGGSTFMGFSMTDMVVYLFVSSLTGQITYCGVSDSVGEEIKDGSICMRLIKPVNTDLSYLFTELGNAMFKLLILAVPMLLGIEIYRYCVTGMIMFNPLNFLLYLVSITLAYLITFRVNLCFGFVAFYVKNLWGFGILKNSIINFLSGSLIPLAFMPDVLKNILGYLPFSSMSYTPVMLYMGKYGASEILFRLGIQAIWAIALYGLSEFIWSRAVKKLCVQGG